MKKEKKIVERRINSEKRGEMIEKSARREKGREGRVESRQKRDR